MPPCIQTLAQRRSPTQNLAIRRATGEFNIQLSSRARISMFEYPAFCRTIHCRVPYKHLTHNSADNLEKRQHLPAPPLCSTTVFAAVPLLSSRLFHYCLRGRSQGLHTSRTGFHWN